MPLNLDAAYGGDFDAALTKMKHVIAEAAPEKALSSDQIEVIANAVLRGGKEIDQGAIVRMKRENDVAYYKFVATYAYDHKRWAFELWARNRGDADAKLAALKATASLDGQGLLEVRER